MDKLRDIFIRHFLIPDWCGLSMVLFALCLGAGVLYSTWFLLGVVPVVILDEYLRERAQRLYGIILIQAITINEESDEQE